MPPEVGEEEVREAVDQYRFVLDRELTAVPKSEQWWEADAHKRRLGVRSPKAYEWLEPFVQVDLVRMVPLESVDSDRGPLAARQIVKELRAAIRAKRKAKEGYLAELQALYGAAILADFADALAFEYTGANVLAAYLHKDEVRAAAIEYSATGYEHITALGKTDVKWLVANFGEPETHRTAADALRHLRETAITRYCWVHMRRGHASRLDMETWLAMQVTTKLAIQKDDAERRSRPERRATRKTTGQAEHAWLATQGTFVIADLETTGLSARTDDVIEYAALRVSPTGRVEAKFSALVRIGRQLPSRIVDLTGITDRDLEREGMAPEVALGQFLQFLEDHPVFFHNASFDVGFIEQSAQKLGIRGMKNPVYDTLAISRQVWPELPSHKLRDLAQMVGAISPNHRGSVDCQATLAVLIAARDVSNTTA